MRYTKALLIILFAAFIPATVTAQTRDFDFTSKNQGTKCYYKITSKTDKTVAVSYKNKGYGSYKGNVFIPDTVRWMGKTYNVTSIRDSAFFGCEKLDTVEFPSTLKHIGEGAFQLSKVKQIVFNGNIDSIDDGAFALCSFQGTFTVTVDMKHLGDYLFESSDLTELIIEAPELHNSKTFNNIPSLKKVTIGENVTYLPTDIFKGSTNIENIEFNAVNYSALSPFDNMSSILDVKIGNKVTTLCENFMRNAKNLFSIDIPQSVKIIGSHAFAGSGLQTLHMKYAPDMMGEAVFQDCQLLKMVELPDDLTVILNNMFEGCDLLMQIKFPYGLKTIENAAFRDCPMLRMVDLNSNIQSIGDSAFMGCDNLSMVRVTAKKPPVIYENTFTENDNGTQVMINCSSILSYKNAPYWKDMRYPCDMDLVTVDNMTTREVYDSVRKVTFSERILNTSDLSYIIINEREHTVALVNSGVAFKDDINRDIVIPPQILDGDVIYDVIGIESIGICRSVYIPESVKTIKEGIFTGIDLKEITVDEDNPYFSSVDGVLYSKDKQTLIAVPPAKQSAKD